MKILVTGGSGFIGSWIVDKLIEKGEEVIAVDLKDYNWDNKEKVNFREVDILDQDKLNELFEEEKPEVVLHLAANTLLRKSLEDPMYDARLNILGTISVLECCRKNNVRKIIYTSTGGARVGEPEYLPVDEKHPLNPVNPYGISKHTGEHYVWMYNQLYDLDYLIFCFGNVYGPRDSPNTKRLVPMFLDKFYDKEVPMIFGDGEKTRDYLYVLDLVDFIIESIDKSPKNKLFHVANGKQVSVNEIVRMMKEVSNSTVSPEHIEEVKGEVKDILLDIKLVKEELGWNPRTSMDQGLKETWDWVVKNKLSS